MQNIFLVCIFTKILLIIDIDHTDIKENDIDNIGDIDTHSILILSIDLAFFWNSTLEERSYKEKGKIIQKRYLKKVWSST